MNTARWIAQLGLGLAFILCAATAKATPTINTQPTSKGVASGALGGVTFTVVASGSPTPTYQWKKTGSASVLSTNASYTIDPVNTTHGGSYSVIVTSGTSITSNVVTLSVVAAPSGPGGVAAGQTATFVATATGAAPFTYQWYKTRQTPLGPRTLIPGATSATYDAPTTTIAADNDYNYDVNVTDSSGVTTISSAEHLNVFQGGQTITFPAPASPVVSPTPITLTATASSNLPVTYSVVLGSATVSGSNLTLTGVGNVQVHALQAGNADYSSATQDITFTVAKGTPVITWATPAAITVGTALSATQLNATANVAGSFVYSPTSGTVPSVGSPTLSVTFTPTVTANYNNANRSVTLTVNAAPTPTPTVTPTPTITPTPTPTPTSTPGPALRRLRRPLPQ